MRTANSVPMRPSYPPLLSVLPTMIVDFTKGPFLAALFTVFVVHRAGLWATLVSWGATVNFASYLPVALKDALGGYFLPLLAARGATLNDALFYVLISFVIHETMYLGLNGFFFACDEYHWFPRYKIERTPRMALPEGILWKTWKQSLVNHGVWQPFVLFLLYTLVTRFAPFFARDASPVQLSLGETFYHFFMAHLCNEVCFYAAHRLFHIFPSLYARFHKLHHTYVGTIGFAAEYAHPLEQLLANQFPTALYCIAFSRHVHVSIWFVWLGWRLWETYEAHSGYDFSDSPLGKLGLLHGRRARFHDWHHSDNRGNFGAFTLDYLCGTMDTYVEAHGPKGKIA